MFSFNAVRKGKPSIESIAREVIENFLALRARARQAVSGRPHPDGLAAMDLLSALIIMDEGFQYGELNHIETETRY